MPFKKTETASNGVKLETAAITSVSLVKSLLNPTWKMRTIALKTMLIRMLVAFTTTTENFATLGCPAPSSLLTRTLPDPTETHYFLLCNCITYVQ